MNAAYLKRKYNLTPLQYEKLLAQCGHRCPLCRKPFADRVRPPCVDHHHETGLVRGLICARCNMAVGFHHDDGGWFARTGHYLDSPPSIDAGVRVYVPGSLGAAHA